MHLVYRFRHWIKQLCTAIEHHKPTADDRWLLYRGFQLHVEELERLKKSKGSLISINTFLSTSKKIQIAQIFSGQGEVEHPLARVLLQIEAFPARLHSVFFADIHTFSQFPAEMEVLFSLGSTFRIQSIDFDDDKKYWIVRLDATDDGSDRIKEYCQVANYDLLSASPMLYFGRVLNEHLDQADRAVRYFHDLLEAVETTHPELAEIYEALGDAYTRRKEINRAIKYYKMEGKIRRKQGTLPSTPDQKIHQSLRTRLEQEEKKTSEPNLVKADLLCQLANASKYAQAEIYFDQALQIYEQLKLDGPLTSACMRDLA